MCCSAKSLIRGNLYPLWEWRTPPLTMEMTIQRDNYRMYMCWMATVEKWVKFHKHFKDYKLNYPFIFLAALFASRFVNIFRHVINRTSFLFFILLTCLGKQHKTWLELSFSAKNAYGRVEGDTSLSQVGLPSQVRLLLHFPPLSVDPPNPKGNVLH